jgi:transcriptional regulator with XRE-family HTH domain
VVDENSAAAKLGAEIRRRRVKAGMTGRGLAEAAGVGASTLYDTEAGVNSPTVAVLARIDKALSATGKLLGFAYRLEW